MSYVKLIYRYVWQSEIGGKKNAEEYLLKEKKTHVNCDDIFGFQYIVSWEFV